MAEQRVAFSKVEWYRLPPGYRHVVRLALEKAKRLPRCLACVRPGVTPHAYIPEEAYRLDGIEHTPMPYKLCRTHHGMSTTEAGRRLGFLPWDEPAQAEPISPHRGTIEEGAGQGENEAAIVR